MKKLIFILFGIFMIFADFELTGETMMPIAVGVTEAEARPYRPVYRHPPGQINRVARRTSRRTTRRVAGRHYYSALPAGCFYASPYYTCGSVYYRPVIENGVTVYVIVD
jgi:hypothetical protein